MFERIESFLQDWLMGFGVQHSRAVIVADYASFALLVFLSLFTYFIAKKVLLTSIHNLTKKSKSSWDDILLEKGFFRLLAYLLPAYLVYTFTPAVLPSYPETASVIRTLLSVFMILVVLLAMNAFLNTVTAIYEDMNIARRKPIKGYIQVLKIIIFCVGSIIIIAQLFGVENPMALLGGLGAFSAVLLLVFKDPILGFVGGIQLSANNMLAPGDWISMPKYDADGTVIDIALTTVKVQNWDKTISTIPTYSLITDSFKNWRGMEESGGRRIKRSINLDMKSVKFCTQDMLAKYKKIQRVKNYVEEKEIELGKYNEENQVDNSVLVNGRRQTNLGVFRAYLREYLTHHPKVNQEMTLLVRHLQPTDKGLPMEIYIFSKEQEWAKYEDLQSDIFDHVLAVIPEFDLRVFQNPTGDDLQKALIKQP